MAETEGIQTGLTPEEVVRQHARRVYNLARRLLGNDADAEDVTQDVLLQVLLKLPTFRGESAVATWVHRVAVNAALGYRRKRALRDRLRAPEAMAEEVEAEYTPAGVRRWALPPDQELLDRERRELVEAALGRLPEKYRDVYFLSEVEGLPDAEIGGLLGLGVPAVKTRLHRARLMMRDALAPHFEEKTA